MAAVGRGPQLQIQTLRESGFARRLLASTAILGGFCIGVRVLAHKFLTMLLYHPLKYKDDLNHERTVKRFSQALHSISYRLQVVKYKIASGSEHCAFLVQPEAHNASLNLWAVFGGNAMIGTDWFSFCWDIVSKLPDAGERPAFLFADYPGYGSNSGSPSPRTVLETQLGALWAAKEELPADLGELHLLGHSLGCAAASQLAVRMSSQDVKVPFPRLGRLVLSAPFVSIPAMAQALFGHWLLPYWLCWLLINQQWSNAKWVPAASKAGWRVSIIFGEHDEIVPTWMGRALGEAVQRGGCECKVVELSGFGHNDITLATAQYATLMGLSAARGAAL